MKSGAELVKAGVRAFFENASEDLEKLHEMLKLGKFMQSRAQMKSVTQSINYVTAALLPILTALFEHVKTHDFGVELLGECPVTRRHRGLCVLCVGFKGDRCGTGGQCEKDRKVGC